MLNDLLAKNQSSGKLYVEDVFSTYLYTGTGSSQTITTGVDLSANSGMVWIKGRSGATDHAIYDTTRGVQKDLVTNTTAAETTQSTGLTAFSSTGFTVGALAKLNTNAATYASWTFRKAPKFFDVLTWTGDGNNSRTISHTLASQPGMIILKTTSGVSNWSVFARNGATYYSYLRLNTNDAASSTTNVQTDFASSTLLNVGWIDANFIGANASGVSYVAYLFAHDDTADGVIQCGSYTASGSEDVNVNLGWEPQYVLIKRTSTTGDWRVFDNMRGLYNVSAATGLGTTAKQLLCNTSDAETSDQYVGISATGFNAAFSSGAGTYIYLAIRRGPMRTPTDGTKVYTPINNPTINVYDNAGFPVDLFLSAYKPGGAGNETLVFDRLRGAGTALFTQLTSGETAGYDATMFASNTGIKPPFGSTEIVWHFRRAPGFFDVVCYTGTGVTRTVSHNLGVAPELMIVKRRNTTGDWQVYAGAAGEYLVLNSTAAKVTSNTDRWNNTAPTSTVFSLGTNATVNASGGTYVAYLFATCAGVSKIGSYTGTGTTQQINCGFTNGARFVLIKRTDSTGDWYVYDSARGIVAGNDPYLFLNSTAAEVTNTDYVDAYSAGFELSSTAPAALNANGGTYIYLAIA